MTIQSTAKYFQPTAKKCTIRPVASENPISSSTSRLEFVNFALMAMEEDTSEDESENEVNFTFDELQNAYEKLYVEYENICLKNKSLKKNAISLTNELEILKNENSKNIKEIESLKNKNSFYKNEIEILNVSSTLSIDSIK
ncbi:hypothetical protein CFOL_v3_00389 [Cephalotus follicularis]|uniref:Uncharacterized protein n=1 Tax=Cephalotus follicularis TaxID=3775 RepID=A0A1Q3AM96_CEPFO|nr:hypothetical protein CFOL_v3_00389 [Cephalotus follicularis]